MKKKTFAVCALIVLVIFCIAIAGCQQTDDTEPKEYVIQYTDDNGTYQITVTQGMPYTLEVVPTKGGIYIYRFV